MDKIQCCCPVEPKTAADYLRECGCEDDGKHFLTFRFSAVYCQAFISYYIDEAVLIIGSTDINSSLHGWRQSTLANIHTAQQIKMALAIYGIDLERKKDIQ